MPEANRSSPALSSLQAMLEPRLYSLNKPISELPISGYARPGQRKQRPAAVLVALLTDPVPSVLLTVRAHHLARHSGQIAFPGGRREDNDQSVVDTALRETEEETGIRREIIQPVGLLGRYDTITGYRMTAVVGLVEGAVNPEPDQNEVEEVFCVPLDRVADPDSYTHERVRYQQRDYQLLTLRHPRHRIWGATAALLYQLGQSVEPARAWQACAV